jgi:DNA-binding response OmpR family regulator
VTAQLCREGFLTRIEEAVAMAKLLIADEDPSLVKPVAEYFRKQGHTVECLADGPEALKHVLAAPPDVLLMDTFLTSLDVFQLLGHVYEALPDVAMRTVVMTAIGAVGEPIHDWSMPVHAYVLKPCRVWDLILAVEQQLYRVVQLAVPGYSEWPPREVD